MPGADGAPGQDGADGTTFTPSVSADGTLSWTNDGGKENPAAVNIKGPKGDPGADSTAPGPPGPGFQRRAVTLTAAGWTGTAKPFSQTVTVSGILADETAQGIWPTPAAASQAAYNEAQIMCTAQGADSLTFQAQAKPTGDISMYVLFAEVE